ncbi:gentisate 1,2-dioxygenase [Colletotrichum spaethianum]|uniref:Gentisate 1,2-dioxygenase n=1 Tax=Colletotrichum spaethianum TaxID=700344 RepID=A0AA37UKI0_9PEZI|nr:gentisate 1,2-dioxygenase [Colletotrichum spaethianum]GKT50086.1 gentisate 1,2-dioxygenase [Colletotrichum spaethianum]
MSSTTVTETPNHTKTIEDETSQMLRAAEASHTKPLWLQMSRLNPPLPNPRCTPHLWRYSEIQPTLLQAGQLVTEQQAERRVLMLVNPSRGAL